MEKENIKYALELSGVRIEVGKTPKVTEPIVTDVTKDETKHPPKPILSNPSHTELFEHKLVSYELKWTGWKERFQDCTICGQWYYFDRDAKVVHYSSIPGKVGTIQVAEGFDIGWTPDQENIFFTLKDGWWSSVETRKEAIADSLTKLKEYLIEIGA
jgi:hypothetical protein